jgi:hypothetical protein
MFVDMHCFVVVCRTGSAVTTGGAASIVPDLLLNKVTSVASDHSLTLCFADTLSLKVWKLKATSSAASTDVQPLENVWHPLADSFLLLDGQSHDGTFLFAALFLNQTHAPIHEKHDAKQPR